MFLLTSTFKTSSATDTVNRIMFIQRAQLNLIPGTVVMDVTLKAKDHTKPSRCLEWRQPFFCRSGVVGER